MLEGRLKDGGDGWIREQVVRPSDSLAVLPRLLFDQHAAGEEIVGMAPNLSAHLKERSERWTGWRGEFRRMAPEPEPLRALGTCKILALAQHGRPHAYRPAAVFSSAATSSRSAF